MSYTQVLLVAAAAAILLGPQLVSLIRKAPGVASSSVRSKWIADILALQAALKASGRAKAAALCSQLAQALIEDEVTTNG